MIVGLLQARMSSTRLPGKVLKEILGRPMILQQLARLSRCKNIERLIVATSIDQADDVLARTCEGAGYEVFRGDLDNVLDRFKSALTGIECDHVVRLTADCPLTDPELIDEIIESHLASGADYTSNTLKPTYPDGLDAEVFKFGALCQAWEHATLPSHREHVTPYIYNHPELFSLNSFEAEEDLSDHRWTVDESEDFQFVSEVYQYFLDKMPFVSHRRYSTAH